jgi:hypothetical protein
MLSTAGVVMDCDVTLNHGPPESVVDCTAMLTGPPVEDTFTVSPAGGNVPV